MIVKKTSLLLKATVAVITISELYKNVQVCFDKDTEVTGIATQGDPDHEPNFVKTFFLDYNTTANSTLRPFFDDKETKKVMVNFFIMYVYMNCSISLHT